MIFVDPNVLIDLLQADARWAAWSEIQLTSAMARGERLAINAIVCAEVAYSFSDAASLDAFLSDFAIAVDPIPRAAAFAASRAHQRYRVVGGARTATLPDFFIAAHAQAIGARLLMRDATCARTYFLDLSIIVPA